MATGATKSYIYFGNNENFEQINSVHSKMKKIPPDIHPRNKCTKFQPGLPQSFMYTDRHLLDSSSTEVENIFRLKLKKN